MVSPRPQPQRGLSSLAARAAAAAAAVGDDSAVRTPQSAASTPRPAYARRQSSADFGAFVGSSSALDWGIDAGASSSASPSAAAPTSQPDWSAWDSLASSSTATPLPSTTAGNSGGLGFNAADDAFFAAFEQATLSSSASAGAAAAGKGRESPPIIDLRPTERKLAAQAAARSPRISTGTSAGRTASQSRQAEEDFFAAFERSPEETLRRLPKPPALMGDDLEAMTDARLSPMAIPASPHTARQEYFSTAQPAAQEREKQSQQEEEQGWTGSLKRTWGSLRGLPAGIVEHLPSVADFVVPPGDGSSGEEEDARIYAERMRQRAGRDGAGAKERRPSSSSTSSSASAPKRGLAHAADYSSSTPFGTSSSGGPSSAPRRGSTLGSTSGATLSGAPGFAAGTPQRWNTGSWSLPAASPSATRQPIPVTLVGRAEESETCITHWHASRLQAQLPPRSQLGKTWKLLYNLDQHGISLQTMYANVASGLSSSGAARGDSEEVKEGWLRGASREARAALGESRRVGGGLELKDAGIVVAVIDSRENVFGAYLNERLRSQSSYYGSGECFLWKTTRGSSSTADDAIKVFRWTGRNDYVALTEHSFLSFGGGDGRYGLWLDGRLEHGVSARCPAFDNDVLCEGDADVKTEADAKEERFEVLCVEVWAVGID